MAALRSEVVQSQGIQIPDFKPQSRAEQATREQPGVWPRLPSLSSAAASERLTPPSYHQYAALLRKPVVTMVADAEAATPTVPVGDLFLDEEERFEIFTVKAAERPHLLSYQEGVDEARTGIDTNSGTTATETVTDNVEHANASNEELPQCPCMAMDTACSSGATRHPCDSSPSQEEKKDASNCEGGGVAGRCAGVAGVTRSCEASALPPPLVDGCDLPGWRRHRLAYDAESDEIGGVLNVGSGSPLFRRADQLCCPPRRSAVNADDVHSRRNLFDFQALMDHLTTTPPSPEFDADVLDSDEYAELVYLHGETIASARESSKVSDTCTCTRFAAEYERRNIPAKILGAARAWKAMPSKGNGGWTFDNLVKRFGNLAWRFSDVHGEMLTLRTYSKYVMTLEGITDDSPLAIYDAEFGDDGSPTSVLLDEYTVPACFSPDLFDLALPSADGDDSNGSSTSIGRPPYRWILIGPARSGTGLHVDPLWTNAWVTVLQGLKRWLLFPPCTPPEKIGMFEDQPQIPSSVWFRDYYERVTSMDWPEEWRPVEVLQRPGETVFVPNGWPHLVLNLELTVAVTHNYASEKGPFERMWEEVATCESDFARRWYAGMMESRKHLADRVKRHHTSAFCERSEWALQYGHLIEK